MSNVGITEINKYLKYSSFHRRKEYLPKNELGEKMFGNFSAGWHK